MLTGEGVLRGGQPSGRIKVEWRDGAVRQAAQKLALEGIAFSGEFEFDAATRTWASAAPGVLKVGTISTGRFGARNLLVHVRLDQRLVAAIEVARVEIAGGDLAGGGGHAVRTAAHAAHQLGGGLARIVQGGQAGGLVRA